MEGVGVVLVGGRSVRMGAPKAELEWHGSTLARRTAGVLRRGAGGPVVVVAAPQQALPALGPGVEVVTDPVGGRGPLQGLAVGLAAAARHGEAAFVCATDLPLLHPCFVRRVLAGLAAGVDVALPLARGHRQPLAAAYRTDLAALVADLLAGGEDRPAALLARCSPRMLDAEALLADPGLAAVDGSLESLRNVNTPAEYAAARALPPPRVLLEVDPTGTAGLPRRTARVRAATLGAAAVAAGLEPGAVRAATVDGTAVPVDPAEPLAEGEVVVLRAEAPDAGGSRPHLGCAARPDAGGARCGRSTGRPSS